MHLIFAVIFYVLPLMFGRRKFLCSDSNLIEALENPSGYCQAQGESKHSVILYLESLEASNFQGCQDVLLSFKILILEFFLKSQELCYGIWLGCCHNSATT